MNELLLPRCWSPLTVDQIRDFLQSAVTNLTQTSQLAGPIHHVDGQASLLSTPIWYTTKNKMISSCVPFLKCVTAPRLATLNDEPYEYEFLSFVLGMWVMVFNKPVEFNYVIFILLNVR